MFKIKIRTHLDLLSIPQSGEKMSKYLDGIIGCKYKPLNGFPDGSTIGSTVQYRGDPTIMLYAYINHHAGTPDNSKTKTFFVHNKIGL